MGRLSMLVQSLLFLKNSRCFSGQECIVNFEQLRTRVV